jgi:hypothetical protein
MIQPGKIGLLGVEQHQIVVSSKQPFLDIERTAALLSRIITISVWDVDKPKEQ